MASTSDPAIAGDPGGCPWDAVDADECAFIRERSVAGVSDDIPSCPAHDESCPQCGGPVERVTIRGHESYACPRDAYAWSIAEDGD